MFGFIMPLDDMLCLAIAMLEPCLDMPCDFHVSRCDDVLHA